MDHRKLDTTKRLLPGRRDTAAARPSTGSPPCSSTGTATASGAAPKHLLDSEHARRAIGEVAVPFGVCAEPSNVKAGGGACPFRFRCAGCDHFRTDVSYLPDLQAYLDDLLRTRERLLRRHRPRRLGTRRSHALRRGDHPHPPAHRPDQHRSRRPHRRGASPHRAAPSPPSAGTAPSCSACPASAKPCPTSARSAPA